MQEIITILLYVYGNIIKYITGMYDYMFHCLIYYTRQRKAQTYIVSNYGNITTLVEWYGKSDDRGIYVYRNLLKRYIDADKFNIYTLHYNGTLTVNNVDLEKCKYGNNQIIGEQVYMLPPEPIMYSDSD